MEARWGGGAEGRCLVCDSPSVALHVVPRHLQGTGISPRHDPHCMMPRTLTLILTLTRTLTQNLTLTLALTLSLILTPYIRPCRG